MSGSLNGKRALDELYWRDEILQALFWLQGESLADAVDSAQLARFLASDSRGLGRQLSRLAADGYLARVPGRTRRYRLSELGRLEGGRRFQDEFAELMHPSHGECAPGCYCHDPDHAGEECPSHPRKVPA